MPDTPATSARVPGSEPARDGASPQLRKRAEDIVGDLQRAHKAVDVAAGFIGAGVTDEQIGAARRALTELQRSLWAVAHDG